MNKHFFILLLLLLSTCAFSQILQWQPLFATADDTITIIYDATQGDGGLVGASSVYAHTGVLTGESQAGWDWKYVKTSWGQNTPETKLTPLGNNKWQIRFHIRSYYNIPHNVRVTHLAFVFRDANSTHTGRNTDGSDIFLPLSDGGASTMLLRPDRLPAFHSVGDTLEILFVASGFEELRLFLNDQLTQTTQEDTLRRLILTTKPGKTNVRIEAIDAAGAALPTSFYYIVNAPLTIEPLPDNLGWGIHYQSDSEVVLALEAPHKEFVYLIGDWNDWQADPNYYLKQTPDGRGYWIRLSALTPGMLYRYQYWVDGNLKIADPYTELVLDPDHDRFIDATTFPNMPPYPEGKTTGLVSTLQSPQQTFNWTSSYQRPAKENLVIYELLLRDFIDAHNYITLIDTLNYFQRLGVNAIELMPVSEFEGNISWGYNPSFYFAPDKYYGRKIDLQRFVDEAHKRGIAVILDVVLNHSYSQSPMVTLYANQMWRNPWYNETSPNPVFSWGYDFNHQSPATQAFVDRVLEHWLREYHIDGYRFDFTKGFTNKSGDGWAHDNSRIAILRRIADHIRSIDSEAFIILEHFAENSEEKELAAQGMMLWGNLNYNFNEATMGYNENGKSDFSWGIYSRRGWDQPNLVTYMESHDEERLMFKNKKWGNSSGGYNIKNETTALARIELAAAFFFTIPGPKMIWQFGEMGYDYSIDYNGRVDPKPIRWDYLDQPARQKLFRVFSALIKLKQKHKAFRSDDITFSLTSAFKWMRITDDSMNVVVVGNFDVTPLQRRIEFHHEGRWFDYFSGESMQFEAAHQDIRLEPGEYHIFTDVPLKTPKTQILEAPSATPTSFGLWQNFPNPFNPNTTITFSIPTGGQTSLVVFNLAGQKIKTLWQGWTMRGEHAVSWDGLDEKGRQVSSGVYLYRLTTSDRSTTRKMLLTR